MKKIFFLMFFLGGFSSSALAVGLAPPPGLPPNDIANGTAADTSGSEEKEGEKCTKTATPTVTPCDRAAILAKAQCQQSKLDEKKKDIGSGGKGIKDSSETCIKNSETAAAALKDFGDECEKAKNDCTKACTTSRTSFSGCISKEFENDSHRKDTVATAESAHTKVQACEGFTSVVEQARTAQAAQEKTKATCTNIVDDTDDEDKDKDKDPKKEADKKDPAKKADAGGGAKGGGEPAKDAEAKKDSGAGGGSPSGGDSGSSPTAAATPPSITTPTSTADNSFKTSAEVKDAVRSTESSETPANADGSPAAPGGAPQMPKGMQVSRSPASSVGGSQGGGGINFGGDAAFNNGDKAGAEGDVKKSKYPSLTTGGGGSGGGGGGGGSGGGWNGTSIAATGKEKATLKDYLPGAAMDPKRVGGVTIGEDGVTGPNTFNWNKMSDRYWKMRNQGPESNFIGD